IQHALRPQDVVGAVAFGGDARVLTPPSHEPLTPAALVAAADSAGLDPDASNLAGALALSTPLCPDATQPAILLFSDGQETRGSALAEASMTEPPVPIFPVALPETELPRATIRRVLAPVRAPGPVLVPTEPAGASPPPPAARPRPPPAARARPPPAAGPSPRRPAPPGRGGGAAPARRGGAVAAARPAAARRSTPRARRERSTPRAGCQRARQLGGRLGA